MRVLRIVLSASVLSVAAFLPASAVADPGDIGHEGPSYAGAGDDPTGEKPESKLWFNDGIWWASLWDAGSGRFEIHRLDTTTQTWASTNVPLDTRANTRADTLWDGSKLYVASHVFGSPASNNPANLWRFSYNAANDTYTLDSGWPQVINTQRSESLVIDKDSTGQLWATWVQGSSGNRRVYVNRTTSGDSAWGAPFELPVANTAVDNDDISALVAFGGTKIGVFWSNQKGASFHFAVHDDAAADTTWNSSVGVYPGANNADDHMNLKSLQTDGSGRVFAVVKTSHTRSVDPTAASIVVLVRSNSAVWTAHQVWNTDSRVTRPIMLLDTTNNRAHVFAAKESGGSVYTKTSPLSSISFASGLGTEVMKDASANDINNPTSTKQNVSSASGLVVLASNDTTDRYWHHFDALGGFGQPDPNPDPPTADFSATPTSGSAPLTVSFSDASSGTPTSWAWDFDDDGTIDSTTQNPSHTYDTAGSYTVSLTATNADGSDVETKTDYITVGQAGSGGDAVTATPVADTHVRADKPTSSFGNATTLWARSGSKQANSYLRFTVSGVGSAASATLRLYVADSSPDAGTLYRVADNTWTESMLWAGQPTLGMAITDLGSVTTGDFIDIDVSSYVTGDGTYSFGIVGESSNQVRFSSSEGETPPKLIVTPSGGSAGDPDPVPPTADFSATPTSGSAPLTVSFSDASSGTPTSWAWDFDDDGTIDSTTQNPSHTYDTAGSYTVSLTATNADGFDVETKTDYITVGQAGSGGDPVTATPVADTHVRADKPTSSFGSANAVWSRSGSSAANSYLRFTVSGVGSAASATLRLYVADSSPDAGTLYRVADNTWTESMLWAGQPTLGMAITDLGSVTTGDFIDIDVSSYVTGDGTYSFGIVGAHTDMARFYSRDSTLDPELRVVPST